MELFLAPSLRVPVCLYTCVSAPKLLRPQPVLMPSGVPLLPYQRWETESGGPLGASSFESFFDEEPPQDGGPHKGPQGGLPEGPPEGGAGGLAAQQLVRVLEHGDRVIEISDEEMKSIRVSLS